MSRFKEPGKFKKDVLPDLWSRCYL